MIHSWSLSRLVPPADVEWRTTMRSFAWARFVQGFLHSYRPVWLMTLLHSFTPPALRAIVSFLSRPFLGNCCFEGCTHPAGNPWWVREALQIQLPLSSGPEQSRAGGEAARWSGCRELWFHPGECHDGKGPGARSMHVWSALTAENI